MPVARAGPLHEGSPPLTAQQTIPSCKPLSTPLGEEDHRTTGKAPPQWRSGCRRYPPSPCPTDPTEIAKKRSIEGTSVRAYQPAGL